MARSLEENYQGGSSVAVPFIWESRPGTPKIKFRENPLPPLTPPPSYFYTSAKTPTRKHSIPNPFSNIFSKRTARRRTSFPVSPASSSSSSSYSSQFSSPATVLRSRERHEMSNTRKSFESRMVDEDDCESPVSTLCFGIGRRGNAARSRWGYASVIKLLNVIQKESITLFSTSNFSSLSAKTLVF
ncbi:hypothetical protein GH714_011364 [Hevea brasiliensis]|uniref:Uncharacterized protein n=1 Tax=Hevea brasiliensis TaxID=3981 RepID=A0A6A6L690_HEVBR|nr:hypothetical protein GH714_011364 [Hevea brasiliensis]